MSFQRTNSMSPHRPYNVASPLRAGHPFVPARQGVEHEGEVWDAPNLRPSEFNTPDFRRADMDETELTRRGSWGTLSRASQGSEAYELQGGSFRARSGDVSGELPSGELLRLQRDISRRAALGDDDGAGTSAPGPSGSRSDDGL